MRAAIGRRRSVRNVKQALAVPEVAAVLFLAATWELVAQAFDVAFIPTLSGIVRRFFELFTTAAILADVRRSLTNLVIGFALSFVIAHPVGMLMARFRLVQYALEPYVNALLMAPTIVFVPMFFVIFGLSSWTTIGVIILYSTFIMIWNTYAAVRGVDGALIDMARVYGASEVQIFGTVVLRAASPLVLAGTRMGVSRAVEGMINGELFVASVGLGGRVRDLGAQFDAEGILAIIMFVMIVASLAASFVQFVEHRFTSSWSTLGQT